MNFEKNWLMHLAPSCNGKDNTKSKGVICTHFKTFTVNNAWESENDFSSEILVTFQKSFNDDDWLDEKVLFYEFK